MPFPPTPTDVWDVTQPPDTQLLNQGALDIRNLKLDIMQRLSLLSGTLANRPSPEQVNATWGGVGFGLLYFATDNGKIYQWSGTAWTDVTSAFLAGAAPSLQTTGSPVVVSGAAPPSVGQALIASSAVAAAWGTAFTGPSFKNNVVNGTGFQTASSGGVSLAANSAVQVTINWGVTWNDAGYYVFPSLSGMNGTLSDVLLGGVVSQSTTQVVVVVYNNIGAPLTRTVNVLGVHP